MVENSDSENTHGLENGQYKGRDVIQEMVQKLAKSIERECIIMGPVLDQHYFNNADFVEALATFATSHPRNIAKILIENSAQVIRDNGRLITLCRRLNENLRLRGLPEEYHGHSDLFFITDRQTLLLQPNTGKPEITVSINDKTTAAPFVRRFDYAWQRSVPMPGLHTFGL